MAKKTAVLIQNQLYRFCGNGLGIAGLPQEVTAATAASLGLTDVLQAAIQNGNYEPVQSNSAQPAEEGE